MISKNYHCEGKIYPFEVYEKYADIPKDEIEHDDTEMWFECEVCGCGVHRENAEMCEDLRICSDIKCLKKHPFFDHKANQWKCDL